MDDTEFKYTWVGVELEKDLSGPVSARDLGDSMIPARSKYFSRCPCFHRNTFVYIYKNNTLMNADIHDVH